MALRPTSKRLRRAPSRKLSKRRVAAKPRRTSKPKIPASSDELRLRRRHAIHGLLVLPLLGALYFFFGLQNVQPVWPSALAETVPRGAIVARDGTVFAEGDFDFRQYPQGTLAAQVIGFSGQRQDENRYGLEGLELTQDAQLTAGQDLTITLDPHMQSVAQSKVREAVLATGAQNGTATILEAGTGRILAAVSYPDYDPNTQSELPNRDVIANKAFLNLYEPGSVMKPFVIAALLEDKRVSLDEVIETPMTLRVGDQTFRDSAEHDAYLSPWGILRYSSNSGMLELTKRFQDDELLAWYLHFGFGRDIPVPSVYTRAGVVRGTPWVPQDQAAITIGQSMSTTTLQLAAAYSIFANDGVYVAPYLVEGSEQAAPRQIISGESARTLRAMMAYVVDSNEVMRPAMAPNVPVAGKTGTADIFDAEAGEYIEDDFTLTFAGMFPADKPKVTMVVSVQKPRKDTSSTTVAAPLFGSIQREIVSLWPPASAMSVAERED